ncbi:MAG: regulator [Calditrichaeota bacterium]|nr:regulator [Calditrichota bacterium]
MGLYHKTNSGVKLFQSAQDLLSAEVSSIDFAPDGSLWIGGLGGITVYRDEKRMKDITPKNGLPSIYIRSVTRGPDGRMWVGTDRGVACFDGASWSLRHSRRWLLDDDVRDVAFDSHGTAWIATAKGVSAIGQKEMTLAQKAKHFLRICYARHVRPPYLVEKCRLTTPGDTTTWEPRDDDNDGQYTSMYLAMESFRYAATKNPAAQANAKKAFDALNFLQTVTETPGFVARTVVPVSWKKMADANRTISDREWAQMRVRNPREKRVEEHWRLSKDGKWLWKGDTSSDEITGHMFGYLIYYDLAADKAEKKRVGKHICNIVDYIIDGGYVLKDIDGKHTKWAVWSPEKLNNDPDWRAERGINSVEILSYLKLAWHVSGKARYQKEYEKLLYKYHYAENVRVPKTLNPAWRTHIDDELLALAFPCLLMYEENPKLRQLYQLGLDQWYEAVRDDHSPFFNFTYALLSGEDPNQEQSIAWLRDVSLDLISWRRDNTQRRDIQLVYAPELDMLQTSRLLPPSEAGVMRWDRNPWAAVRGDGGRTESDGVFWLLPYWMGRYNVSIPHRK